jgi:hypothetical protein
MAMAGPVNPGMRAPYELSMGVAAYSSFSSPGDGDAMRCCYTFEKASCTF